MIVAAYAVNPRSALRPDTRSSFVLVPAVFLLVYPGTEALGLSSDGHMISVLAVLVPIHGVGFALVRDAHEGGMEERE